MEYDEGEEEEEGEEETKEVKRQSADITSSSNFEGVLAEDIEAENALMRDAQLKDEYNRGIKANKLPKDMTFEQYKTAKSNAGITRELKFEGFNNPDSPNNVLAVSVIAEPKVAPLAPGI